MANIPNPTEDENQKPKPEVNINHQEKFPVLPLADKPVEMICPYCGHGIVTHAEESLSCVGWVATGIACILCGIFGANAWLSGLMPCREVTHKCPACRSYLGSYDPCCTDVSPEVRSLSEAQAF